MLLPKGYNTFCVGQVAPDAPRTPTPPDPTTAGRSAAASSATTAFWAAKPTSGIPELVYDNHAVEQPKPPEEGYHLSIDLADKAIEFIQDAHVNAPDKPFFLYYATGAGHAPHHVPKEWADKYKGKFDMGWDKYREIVHQRQLEMGIIPPGTELSAHDPDVPVWDTLPADAKRLYARFMEVYAGFVSFTDYHFGRILEFLKEIGELDNTLIMVISDNGASSEGGPVGSLNEMFFFNNVAETLEDNLKMIDKLGGVETCNHYPWGWTNAGNTPFRRWKRETYRGGTTDPCIVSWPKGIQARGEVRTQYAHIIDFVPTVLEALGIEAPESIRGVTQAPIDGVSFAHTFNEAAAPSNHHTQYFEMFGHRSIYHDGWRAVCPWPGPSFTEAAKKGRKFGSPITNEVLVDIDAHDWELYHIDEDYSEMPQPGRRAPRQADRDDRPLVGRSGQVPGAADRRQRLRAPQRGAPDHRQAEEQVRLLPGWVAGSLYRRAQDLQPALEHHGRGRDPEGRRRGGAAGPGRQHRRIHLLRQGPEAPLPVQLARARQVLAAFQRGGPGGRSRAALRVRADRQARPCPGKGVPARGQLYINRKLVASIDMPYSILNMWGTEGLTCGYDGGDRVAPEEYSGVFPFTGTIKRVTLDLSGELIPDSEADMKIAMARQ